MTWTPKHAFKNMEIGDLITDNTNAPRYLARIVKLNKQSVRAEIIVAEHASDLGKFVTVMTRYREERGTGKTWHYVESQDGWQEFFEQAQKARAIEKEKKFLAEVKRQEEFDAKIAAIQQANPNLTLRDGPAGCQYVEFVTKSGQPAVLFVSIFRTKVYNDAGKVVDGYRAEATYFGPDHWANRPSVFSSPHNIHPHENLNRMLLEVIQMYWDR